MNDSLIRPATPPLGQTARPLGQRPPQQLLRPWLLSALLCLCALVYSHLALAQELVHSQASSTIPTDTGAVSRDDAVAQQLSEMAKQWAEKHDFSGSWHLQQGDRTLAAGSRGTVSAWSERPIGSDTVFWIGSVSKQFAAVAALLLVERGAMKLDEPLFRYLPQLQPGALGPEDNPCTVDEVLSHRCGLPRDTLGSKTLFGDHLRRPEREQALLQQVNATELLFAPGEDYSYSNLGYSLAALAVQRVAQQPYELFLQQSLWQPLGMAHTGITPRDELTFAEGQAGAFAGWINASDFLLINGRRIGELGAAGNVYSTAADLARWQHALHGGQVLQAATYAELVRPRLADYGLGVVANNQVFGQLIHHDGALSPEGFHSQVGYLPQGGWSVTLLSNRPLGAPPLKQFAGALLRKATGSAPPELSEWSSRDARLLNSLPLLVFCVILSSAFVGVWQLVQHTKPLDVVTWWTQYLTMSILVGLPIFLFQNPDWHPAVLIWLAAFVAGSVYAKWWRLPRFRWKGQPLKVRLSCLLSFAIAGLVFNFAVATSHPFSWSLLALAAAQLPIWLLSRRGRSQANATQVRTTASAGALRQ